MCVNCGILSELFRAQMQYPTIGSKRVYQLLKNLLLHGRLQVYTEAPYQFEQVADQLPERCDYYFQCPACRACYFFSRNQEDQFEYGPLAEIPNTLRKSPSDVVDLI